MSRAEAFSAAAAASGVLLTFGLLMLAFNDTTCCACSGTSVDSRSSFVIVASIVGSYPAAALLHGSFGKYVYARLVPGWLTVTLLGSFLLANALGAHMAWVVESAPVSWEYNLIYFFVFALLSAPFAALGYYSGALARALKVSR